MLWTSGNLWRLGLVWQQCNLAVCVTLFWSPARAECVGVSLCLNIIEPSTLEYRNPKPQILQRREPHHQDSIWCRLLSFECQSRQALHPARVSSAMNTKITQAEWVNACFSISNILWWSTRTSPSIQHKKFLMCLSVSSQGRCQLRLKSFILL